MTELMLEMLVYLGIAVLLGLVLGYLFWGWGQAVRISTARAEGAAGARTSVDGNTALRTQLANCAEERERLEEEVDDLRARLRAKDGQAEAPVLFERKSAAQASPVGAEAVATQTHGEAAGGMSESAGGFAAERAEGPPEPLPVQPEAASVPASLLDERPDKVDDLKRIKGVGKVMEGVLNAKGIYLFRQLANFSARDVAWVNEAIEAFPGRIERDRWVEQAQALYRQDYGRDHDAPGD